MAWGALLTLRQGPKEALGAHQTLICWEAGHSLGSQLWVWQGKLVYCKLWLENHPTKSKLKGKHFDSDEVWGFRGWQKKT